MIELFLELLLAHATNVCDGISAEDVSLYFLELHRDLFALAGCLRPCVIPVSFKP